LVPLLAAGFAFGLATAATELTKGPRPEIAPPTSIVWAGRVFSSSRELAVWLGARGVSYERWAALHPTASSVLERTGRESASAPSPAEPTNRTMAIVALVASLLGTLTLLVPLRARLAQRAPRRRVRAVARPGGLRVAAGAVAPPSSAGRGARTVRRQLATKSRRPIGMSAPLMTLGPRLRGRLRAGLPLGHSSIVAREAVRQHGPDLALYVASGLLACVVGISIALYLD